MFLRITFLHCLFLRVFVLHTEVKFNYGFVFLAYHFYNIMCTFLRIAFLRRMNFFLQLSNLLALL